MVEGVVQVQRLPWGLAIVEAKLVLLELYWLTQYFALLPAEMQPCCFPCVSSSSSDSSWSVISSSRKMIGMVRNQNLNLKSHTKKNISAKNMFNAIKMPCIRVWWTGVTALSVWAPDHVLQSLMNLLPHSPLLLLLMTSPILLPHGSGKVQWLLENQVGHLSEQSLMHM